MQIIPSQFVPHIAAPSGPDREHSHGHGHSPSTVIARPDRKHAEPLAHSVTCSRISAVQKARGDLHTGTLETAAAFNDAADALLIRGL